MIRTPGEGLETEDTALNGATVDRKANLLRLSWDLNG